MSMQFVPDVKPEIDMDRDKSIDLLLASIAFTELGLAHIIRAEAEKIQSVLKMHHGSGSEEKPTIEELLKINKSVERMLRKVIKKEILLEFQLEDILELLEKKDDDDNGHDNNDD